MKKTLLFTLAVAFVVLNQSCDKGTQGRKSMLPNVTGAAGEVIVVLDKSVINDSISKTIKTILEEEFPMIPQSEPIFDAVIIPSSGFSDIFKSHRNIVIVKVDNSFNEAKIIAQHDVWASPQTLINIVGRTYPAIEEMLKVEKDRLIQILEQAERDRVVQNAEKFEEESIRALLEKKFGVSVSFPKGYKINLDTTNFVWISNETTSTSQGVFIYEYPYTETNTFSVDYLVAQRNNFIHKFVPGPSGNSYMSTETIIPPKFSPLMYKGRYFGQLRGLWTVIGHPMGGPFISLTTIDEVNNRVVTIEGYVFAPKFKKRNYVRQVEALLLSIKFPEIEENK
ncbi:MAG: DUF4837 family protein [Bacteroidales bacterium]|jgi:hypothetical protein|nr:DUF4837 family protein [Bacteroidales bacterium]MDD4385401.1 DUF4837 family protein [Bacteroidales bacterium]MDY0197164.1 DUF4837 family protein [Tenuifilaceae bacterium]